MADRVRDRRGLCGAAAIAGRTGASAAARNRGAQSGLRRLHPRRCRRRPGDCTQGGDGHFRRPVAGAIARHPARRERQYRYRRRTDDLPFQNPARQHCTQRRAGHRQPARRRRNHAGQAVAARIRVRRPVQGAAVPVCAPSVEYRLSPRRIVVGLRRGPGRRLCAAVARHRRRRLDPQPGGQLRRGRT